MISAPAQLYAQEAANEVKSADAATVEAVPEEPESKTHCAPGYAFDSVKGACVACNQPCKTGFKGICSRGITECGDGKPLCRPTVKPGERLEICNGDDDDCDGAIDEGYDKDNDRYTTCSGDCNDRDPAIHPDAVERCNDRDDNCNGLIDDGFNIGGACTVGLGICVREGRLICSKSGLESICDIVPGDSSQEICDNLDNDCNGKVDDRLGENTCGVGACQRTVPVCEAGKLTECKPGEPTSEFCGDDIDNNCDGSVDEGFAELGRTCYEGVGACRNAGKYICSGDNLSLSCSAEPGEPRAEICGNRVDDDCDGVIDTDTPGLGDPCDNAQLGECKREGTLVCDRGEGMLTCSAKQEKPRAEICNGKDDDCDGVVDNGVLNECGGCGELPGKIGTPCMVPGGDECATGAWTCNAEEKGTAICVLNAKVSDGRECGSDDNQCTQDVCSAGICTHPPLKDGLPCDDGDACIQSESCAAGKCVGGKPISCDDENICTDDSCDSKKGCVHAALGIGEVNSCGGCDKLAATPGSPCVLKEMFGPCRVGQNICGSDGLVECAQIAFGRAESCNGLDDDCDGDVDDGLGMSTCGIGACTVEVTSCVNGEPVKCVPKDPLPETCGNMGVDDDCNGLQDDVAGLGERCSVPIGTCIVPGKKRCVGDAEKPICVVINPRDAEDEDDNGVANYCEQDGAVVSAGGTEEVGVRLSDGEGAIGGSSKLFNLAKTRAAILPWQQVYGSTVINSASPDRAMLLVSGSVGDRSGVAVFRAKDAATDAAPSFRTCDAAIGEAPRLILEVDEQASAIATTDNGYLRYHKIASQIPSPSAGELACRLYGERVPLDGIRSIRAGGKNVDCEVKGIKDIALLGSSPLKIVGAAACKLKGGSVLSRSRSAVVIDVISQQSGGSYNIQSIPFTYSTGKVERAIVAPIGQGGGAFFAAATIKGKGSIGVCRLVSSKWDCDIREDRVVGSPIVYAGVIGTKNGRVHLLAISKDGKGFDISVDPKGEWAITKTGGAGGRGAVNSAILMPPQKGGHRIALLSRDRNVSAAKVSWTKDGRLRLTGISGERFGPESSVDGIFPGGKFSFGKPQTMSHLPLKRFGGEDFFAVFQMKKGMKDVGEMGFLYLNANEPPRGTLKDIKVSNGSGTVKLVFTDPTGDSLTYRAWIRANHGGSLDHWIDGVEKGKLRFSVKGDAAVGMWPIEITVEAVDSGGQAARVKAVISRDGMVESITETTGGR